MKYTIHTNLDLHVEHWPILYEAPQIGAILEAKSGLQLKVVRVVYKTVRGWGMGGDNDETACEIELHTPLNESIEDFHKRYKAIRDMYQGEI